MVFRIASLSAAASGNFSKESLMGRFVEAVTVSENAPSSATLPINSAAERPTGVSEIWRKADRRFSEVRGMSICRNSSPGLSTFVLLPVTKSETATFRSSPFNCHIVQTPSSAEVSEIIGPAGSDKQRLPPTVAVFQILNDARKARQH